MNTKQELKQLLIEFLFSEPTEKDKSNILGIPDKEIESIMESLEIGEDDTLIKDEVFDLLEGQSTAYYDTKYDFIEEYLGGYIGFEEELTDDQISAIVHLTPNGERDIFEKIADEMKYDSTVISTKDGVLYLLWG